MDFDEIRNPDDELNRPWFRTCQFADGPFFGDDKNTPGTFQLIPTERKITWINTGQRVYGIVHPLW